MIIYELFHNINDNYIHIYIIFVYLYSQLSSNISIKNIKCVRYSDSMKIFFCKEIKIDENIDNDIDEHS